MACGGRFHQKGARLLGQAGRRFAEYAVAFYRDLDRLRDGTFAPLRRALLSPMAIACLRFFTGCLPERMWCISVRTSFCALRPYFRPRERERDVERCDREPLDEERRDERCDPEERCDEDRLERAPCPRRLDELRLVAIVTSC